MNTGINYAKYDQNGYVYEVGRIQDEFVLDMINKGERVVYINPPRDLVLGSFMIDLATKEIVETGVKYSDPTSSPPTP